MEKREVVCPSGMRGVIRALNVGEERQLLLRAKNAKAHQLMHTFVATGWESMTDPGPYAFPDGKVNWDDVLQGDFIYLLYLIRCMTFTPDYSIVVPCRACNAAVHLDVNLETDLHVQDLCDESHVHVGSNTPIRSVFYSGAGQMLAVESRLLRFKDHKLVANIEDQEQVLAEDATLAARLVSVEGVDMANQGGKRALIRWFKSLSGADADALRDLLEDYDCGVDTGIDMRCTACGHEQEVALPLDASFFRRPPTVKERKPKGRRLGSMDLEG